MWTMIRRWLALLCLMFLCAGLALPAPAVDAANTQHVTNCTDTGVSGDGSLRGEIAAAGVGDTIVFDQNCTITLSLANGPLTLAQNVTIDGTGHTVIVDGGCTFNGTVCTSGGVTVFAVNSGVTANLTAVTIQHGNTAGLGGGINNSGTLAVTNSTLTGNNAPQGPNRESGGGIFNTGTLTVTGSTLAGNTTGAGGSGGGIWSNGTLTVTNSTFSGNITCFGGAIESTSPFAMLTVTNSTIARNRVDCSGGGIDISDGTATVTNTIVATNTGGDINGGFSGNNNLIGGAPLLGPLGYYGGPTQTIALLAGSPAIDAGNDAVCAQTGAGKVNGVDQRGITRPQGAHCDIGAFEYLVVNPLPSPKPPGPAGGPPNPLPPVRPAGAPGGVPNPLPVPRP